LKYLYALRRKKHSQLDDFQTTELSNFRIEEVVVRSHQTNTTAASYQIDGDWGGYLPVDIRVLPKRVKIIL